VSFLAARCRFTLRRRAGTGPSGRQANRGTREELTFRAVEWRAREEHLPRRYPSWAWVREAALGGL